MKVLLGGILKAFEGMTIDLLRYLESHGFTTFIASGGDRDFKRPVTNEIYGIPPNASSAVPTRCGMSPAPMGHRSRN